MLTGAVWLLYASEQTGSWEGPDPNTSNPSGKRWLCIKLVIIGLVSGFYVSLITPYLPLVLTAAGASTTVAALTLGGMSCAQIVATSVMTKRARNPRPVTLFFITELGTGVLTLLAALSLGLAPVVLTAILVCRAAFVAIAVAAEETIQYAVIPASASGLIFGASQTAFLIGDALGGAFGAQIWSSGSPSSLLLTGGLITMANAVLLPLILRREIRG